MGTAGSGSEPTKNLGGSEKNHKCNQSCVGGKKSWQINLHPHPMLMFLFSPQRISFWREPQPDSSVNPSCHAKTTSPSSPNQESKKSTNGCAESPLFLSPFPQLGFFVFCIDSVTVCCCCCCCGRWWSFCCLVLLLWDGFCEILSTVATCLRWCCWSKHSEGFLSTLVQKGLRCNCCGFWVGLLNFEGLRIQLAHWYKKQRERRAAAAATGKKR